MAREQWIRTSPVGWAAAGDILPVMAAEADSVYFAPKDYAHPVKRVGAVVIDLAFLIGILYPVGFVIAMAMVPANIRFEKRTPEVQREINKAVQPAKLPLTAGWLAFCLVYHIPLRRTRGGTVGYRLMGIKLVDRTGHAPQMRPLFKRFLIAVPTTLLFGLTYVDAFRSAKRQTSHDLWAGTWAVRKRAQPAGPAIATYNTKFLGTIPTMYIDVEPLPTEAPSQSEPSTAAGLPARTDEPVMESVHR